MLWESNDVIRLRLTNNGANKRSNSAQKPGQLISDRVQLGMHSFNLFIPVSLLLFKIFLLIRELLGEIGVSFFNFFKLFLHQDPAFSLAVHLNFQPENFFPGFL